MHVLTSPEHYHRASSGLWVVMAEFDLKRLGVTCVPEVAGLVTLKTRAWQLIDLSSLQLF